jgi:hypothetical protein
MVRRLCDDTWCGFEYFRCSKKALRVSRRGNSFMTQCTLFGGSCIGYKCQYAFCDAHVMAPSGECLLELRNKAEEERDIVREARRLDQEASKINRHLRKLGMKDYM